MLRQCERTDVVGHARQPKRRALVQIKRGIGFLSELAMATQHKSSEHTERMRTHGGDCSAVWHEVANASRPYGLLEYAWFYALTPTADLQQRDERLDEAEGKATPQKIAV